MVKKIEDRGNTRSKNNISEAETIYIGNKVRKGLSNFHLCNVNPGEEFDLLTPTAVSPSRLIDQKVILQKKATSSDIFTNR